MIKTRQKNSKLELKSNPEALKKVLAEMNVLKTQKEKELRIIHAAITKIKQECPHQIMKVEAYGGATCSICGTQFGWWCPASPKHYCEYNTSEDCIHCGAPEERK